MHRVRRSCTGVRLSRATEGCGAATALILLASLAGTSCAAGTTETTPVETKIVGELLVATARPGWLPSGLLAISRATGVPIGIEVLPDPAPADCTATSGGTLDVSGLRASEALARLLRCDTRYEHRTGTNGIEIRPRAAPGADTFVDAVVPVFDVRDVTLQEAIEAVHRSINPGHRGARGGARTDGPSRAPPVLLDTRLSLHRERATVATILHDLARAFGGVSWVVDYPGGRTGYKSSRITFWSIGERRWGVAVNARASGELAQPR